VSYEINNVLRWLNCKHRLQFEILKLAFPVFHGSGPPYFSNYLDVQHYEIRHLRRSSYLRPSQNVTSWWGERSFKFNASKLWLQLPLEISECSSFPIFKILLYKYLINAQSGEYENQCIDNVCDLSCIDDVIRGLTDVD
jgi:hypothetical protein